MNNVQFYFSFAFSPYRHIDKQHLLDTSKVQRHRQRSKFEWNTFPQLISYIYFNCMKTRLSQCNVMWQVMSYLSGSRCVISFSVERDYSKKKRLYIARNIRLTNVTIDKEFVGNVTAS